MNLEWRSHERFIAFECFDTVIKHVERVWSLVFDETLMFDEVFDSVFYLCLNAHSRDRMGLSDWVKFSWINNEFEKFSSIMKP